jgi:glutathione S-transferase
MDHTWVESAGEVTIKGKKEEAPIVLYCSWFCPYAQRAWIALEEKGADYQYFEINPYESDPNAPGGFTKKSLPISEKQAKYPGFVASSPRGLVPALNHGGCKIWDSMPVVEYIDEAFDGPSLLPSNPVDRAQARIWSTHVTERINKPFYSMLMAQTEDGRAQAKAVLLKEMRTLAQAMAPLSNGPFFCGAKFSLVDIAFAPFWQRFIWIGSHYRGLEFPKDDPAFDRLRAWWESVSIRPSVAATIVNKVDTPVILSSLMFVLL